MKNKLFLILFLMAFSFGKTLCKAQNVSVVLSIDWEHKECFMPIANEIDSIPYLVVEYTNLTDTSFYFQQIGNTSDCSFPRFPVDGIYYSPSKECFNLYNLALGVKDKHIGCRYMVKISSLFDVYEIDPQHTSTNDDISTVYTFLRKIIDCGTQFDDDYDWDGGDLTDEKVRLFEKHFKEETVETFFKHGFDTMLLIEKYRKNFVFLSPHSTVSRRYNLIGFWHAGGCYTFLLPKGYQSNDFVYKRASIKKLQLPQSLNGYSLYQGSFLSNEVVLIKP